MTESKQCKCGRKDVIVIHDSMEKVLMPYNALNVVIVGQYDLERMSETSRFIVKKCGQEMESPPKMLDILCWFIMIPMLLISIGSTSSCLFARTICARDCATNCNIISMGK
jgi:hypothetical protein